jgi:hypothetical protein
MGCHGIVKQGKLAVASCGQLCSLALSLGRQIICIDFMICLLFHIGPSPISTYRANMEIVNSINALRIEPV